MRPILFTGLLTLVASCASENPSQVAVNVPASVSATTPDPRPQTRTSSSTSQDETTMTTTAQGLYSLTSNSLAGEPVDLSQYAGQVTLVVNVASRCGYTKQYAGLQELHAELSDKGFSVLGFPSNEFGGQEPGSAQEIAEFCSSRFGVTFPMFAKCEVKPGSGQSPIYGFLEGQAQKVPGWNFCKYLVGKDGNVIAFYGSSVAPDSPELRKAIEAALG